VPGDVPKDSAAWREMVLEDKEYKKEHGRIEKLEKQIATRRGSRALAKARQQVAAARQSLRKLMSKLGKRAVIRARQIAWDEGQVKLGEADEATLLKQTRYEEYPQMSEEEAVGYLLEKCNAVDEREFAKSRKRVLPATAATAALGTAEPEAVEPAREESTRKRGRRREAWLESRARMLGTSLSAAADDGGMATGTEADATQLDGAADEAAWLESRVRLLGTNCGATAEDADSVNAAVGEAPVMQRLQRRMERCVDERSRRGRRRSEAQAPKKLRPTANTSQSTRAYGLAGVLGEASRVTLQGDGDT
jgi:hypothetical protein